MARLIMAGARPTAARAGKYGGERTAYVVSSWSEKNADYSMLACLITLADAGVSALDQFLQRVRTHDNQAVRALFDDALLAQREQGAGHRFAAGVDHIGDVLVGRQVFHHVQAVLLFFLE